VTSRILGGLLYGLADGPVRAEFDRSSFDGTRQQRLVLGDEIGSDKLSISFTETPVDRIDEAIEALQKIRAEKIRNQINQLPEVAA
jgi:hypothetical protein